jgi:enediyne biosynthesis protein E4
MFRRPATLATISAMTFATLSCALAARAQSPQLSDQTAAAGLTAVHTSLPGSQMSWMTSGIAAGDFNNDGWQDLFVLGGPGAPDKLYINNHDGTFTDHALEWGVARTHWGYGIAVGDFNNDGWLDIFITSGGSDGAHCHHLLYRNNGNGTFTDVALQAGVQSTATTVYDGFGAAWGDYDLDGHLDLAVAGWQYGSGGNRLFHNNGDGTFTDATADLGYNMRYVEGFSPRFIDMNGDRYPELLWVADFGTSKYFVNNTDGTFTESTAAAGVGLEGNGMGTTVGDFNNDGRPDWYVTSVYAPTSYPGVPGTGNMLYLNNGGDSFSEVGASKGVRQGGWGWGTVAVDLRNAGRLDIVETNGWPDTYYGTQFLADPSCVFVNNGAAPFTNAAPACGITHTGMGRGVVAFDYNNDGAQDILISTNAGPLTLYRNDRSGPDSNSLRIFLNTHASSPTRHLAPNGYGAHVVATAGGVSQHRWICGGSNFLSQSELSAHFGLGAATVCSQLRIEWPDGSVTLRANVPANQTLTISSCSADWNADGTLNVQDIFDFLNNWFTGRGDFNGSGDTTVQDIFDMLNAWFAGCA